MATRRTKKWRMLENECEYQIHRTPQTHLLLPHAFDWIKFKRITIMYTGIEDTSTTIGNMKFAAWIEGELYALLEMAEIIFDEDGMANVAPPILKLEQCE